MPRYKVTSIRLPRFACPSMSEGRLSMAQELREEYGLHEFSLSDIITKWEAYSESYAAGWLIADKESVEYVFGVTLEEVEDV